MASEVAKSEEMDRSPASTSIDAAQVEESDYLDMDTVKLLDEDFQIISNIRKLSDTARDKLAFTIFTVNIVLSAFLAGYIPRYYYIIYTIKVIVLLSYRWFYYKKKKFHYVFMEFCYFVTVLNMVYIWLPCCDWFRAWLYPIAFAFSNGPVLAGVVLWRNSIVPHSTDKMTSLFLHVAPAITHWGIRWMSLEEQGFPLCANPTSSGPEGCAHIELLLYPMFVSLLWQTFYYFVVYFWRNEKIEQKKYVTVYKLLAEKSRKSTLYRLCNMFGPRYRKVLFSVYQFLFTIFFILMAYPCYHNFYTTVFLVIIAMVVASYNGASFYIDVFSRHSYSDSNNKHE